LLEANNACHEGCHTQGVIGRHAIEFARPLRVVTAGEWVGEYCFCELAGFAIMIDLVAPAAGVRHSIKTVL
jgi:hypothetical protein